MHKYACCNGVKVKTLDIRKQTRKNKVYSRKINSSPVVKTSAVHIQYCSLESVYLFQWLLRQ
jgi:hypothetical protein